MRGKGEQSPPHALILRFYENATHAELAERGDGAPRSIMHRSLEEVVSQLPSVTSVRACSVQQCGCMLMVPDALLYPWREPFARRPPTASLSVSMPAAVTLYTGLSVACHSLSLGCMESCLIFRQGVYHISEKGSPRRRCSPCCPAIHHLMRCVQMSTCACSFKSRFRIDAELMLPETSLTDLDLRSRRKVGS